MLTVVSFVLVLGVLIFVHELGHFMAAKSVGIGVSRFSIGLGPVTPLRFRRGETEYAVSWIPFGGYVKMATREQEDMVGAVEGGDVEQEFPADRMFEAKPVAARILVISAGVIMNALFAWGVYTAMALVYGRVEDPTTRIAAVAASELPAGAQSLAEIPFGTRILAINRDTVRSWNEVADGFLSPGSDAIVLELEGVGTVTIPISGFDQEGRLSLYNALKPLRDPVVGLVSPGTPAAEAGLESLDRVLFIAGDTIRYMDQMIGKIEANAGVPLEIIVARGGELLTFEIEPAPMEVVDPVTGDLREVGRIGIGFHFEPLRVTYGLWDSFGVGLARTAENAGDVWFALKGLVTGRLSPKELGGPIMIGQLSGQFAALGPEYLLGFMAFFSVNLAILNLLPIPVLDGGHLVFLLLEAVRRKPVSTTVRMRLSQVGLVLLLGLMALAVTNDLVRLFS